MSFAPSPRALRRATALAGLTALLAGSAFLVSSAAQADETAPVDLSVTVPDQGRPGAQLPIVGLPLDGETKDLRVQVKNDATAAGTATGVTLDFKLPAPNAAGSVSLAAGAPSTCQVNDDGSGSCLLSDLKPGSIANLRLFTVTSLVADKKDPRRIGRVSLTVSSEQPDADESDNEHRFVVTVRKKTGLDLATWVRQDDLVVRPGQTGELTAADYHFTNDSNTPARGLFWTVLLPVGMSVTSVPQGCEVGELGQDPTQYAVECELPDVELGAHAEYSPQPIGFKVAADAPARAKLDGLVQVSAVAFGPANAEDDEEFTETTVALSTPETSEKKVKKYLDEHSGNTADNNAEFAVFTYADEADLAIALSVPDAKVGGESLVTATVTNNGPWAIEDGVDLTIKAPSGTTLQHSAAECQAGPDAVVCHLDGEIEPGATREYVFSLRVDAEQVGDDGSVTVGANQPDPKQENNVAALKPKVLGDGPSGTPTTSPSDPGDLPVTGASLTLMGIAAAALVAAGGAFLIVARRKRAAAMMGTDEE
ncbi:LPXTG cell wall anchor domain-containing protein [Phytomonospora sp. NPDC050363]|uniref:LPXTG cell wall anchor domain-containing protein n=1 Tax=Phytomonospora sp. NPDC050363 TaxID=3155642 RepID=UPI003408C3F4